MENRITEENTTPFAEATTSEENELQPGQSTGSDNLEEEDELEEDLELDEEFEESPEPEEE